MATGVADAADVAIVAHITGTRSEVAGLFRYFHLELDCIGELITDDYHCAIPC